MAFISEIHYQNSYANSIGVSEFVEISLSANEFARVGDFEFAAYQGTGTASLVINLGTVTPVLDPDNGHYVFTIQVTTTSPDTNPLGGLDAEAVSLVDNSLASPVIDFYDIGGGTTAITANDGPAAGATSTNIPASPGGTSIQFTKSGIRIDGVLTEDSTVICFCEKTLIETANGMVPVEALKRGDLILNDAGDFVPLRWIGGRHLSGPDLRRNPKFLPIRISAGALGQGLPKRDLSVSRQHRILINSKIAKRVTGARDVLVSAIKLINLPGIFVDTTVQRVRYFHLLFDRHQIIFAENAGTESLFMGPEALDTVSVAAKAEILALFPEFDQPSLTRPACNIPNGKMQKEIAARHVKNAQPLQSFPA